MAAQTPTSLPVQSIMASCSHACTPESVAEALSHATVRTPLRYGTAGFRGRAEHVLPAMQRIGVLAGLRSAACDGLAVALMITASHNPPCDNGAKIIDADAGMLCPHWEAVAAPFVNANSPQIALRSVRDLLPPAKPARTPLVIIGADTRASSPAAVQAARKGAEHANALVLLAHRVTTPQLHFLVREWNCNQANCVQEKQQRDHQTWLRCAMQKYYHNMANAFLRLAENSSRRASVCDVLLDCANGVGASAAKSVLKELEKQTRPEVHPAFNIHIVNDHEERPELLNERCGAEWVHKKHLMPHIYAVTNPTEIASHTLCAALDGDADRLVFFQRDPANPQHSIVLDGDRICVLAAHFIAEHLRIAAPTMRLGAALTAYSNGAAVEYLRSKQCVDVVLSKTGVKNLEKVARDFHIALYWEPNGHGTVLFSPHAQRVLHELCMSNHVPHEKRHSAKMLCYVRDLANQTVGDGISDLLLILAILTNKNWSVSEWTALYEQRCSTNGVVRVNDKNVIKTSQCDTIVDSPLTLKQRIDEILREFSGCRAFARPSGTEDVVRVYAEAPHGQEQLAETVKTRVLRAVFDTCCGVGERP